MTVRAADLLQPLVQEPASCSLQDVATRLRGGTPVAFAGVGGWRYVRAIDALEAPATRQLCDVPSVPLPTVDIASELDMDALAAQELLGITSGGQLVGAIDCHRVLLDAAKVSTADGAALMALTIRERLMPRMLHDLGNAITVATLADDDTGDDETGVAEALSHAASLVHQMRQLFVSEPEPAAPFDVGNLVTRIEPMLHLAARPLSLSLSYAGSCRLVGAWWRLERVLLNLVLNASEAAAEGRIQIRVTSEEEHVRIDVDDDGPGFSSRPPPDRLLRGYGFTIVRRQVALLGGDVTTGASPLGGARVTLRLPCAH